MKNWRTVHLELARSDTFPAGSVSRAYLIQLPLDDNDCVDEGALLNSPHLATVRRHWSTDPDEVGLVQETDHGWAMACNGTSARTIDWHGRAIRLGAQISVIESDGDLLQFRIASIR